MVVVLAEDGRQVGAAGLEERGGPAAQSIASPPPPSPAVARRLSWKGKERRRLLPSRASETEKTGAARASNR